MATVIYTEERKEMTFETPELELFESFEVVPQFTSIDKDEEETVYQAGMK